MSESAIQRQIRARMGALRIPLFRYQCGTFLTPQGTPIHIGEKGVSDLIGFIPHTITPVDVGSVVAVFTALEVKQPRGRLRAEQGLFLRMVNAAGGLGAVVRSAEDAEAVVREKWECELVKKYSV